MGRITMARTRIMYIEAKSEHGIMVGRARIGRVRFSKTGATLYYGDRRFQRVRGFKHNHVDVDTGEPFWISGPRRDGADRLYGEGLPIHVDDDVAEEYWSLIRRRA